METKPTVMVSACLLGVNCRYDGGSKTVAGLVDKLAGYEVIPFCPEVLGKLPTPRPPAEINAGNGAEVLAGQARVINRAGLDVTAEFCHGATKVLELAEKHQPRWILLKAKSPSCGVNQIYDGTFSGALRPGDGVAVALLRQKTQIPMGTEEDLPKLLPETLI